VAAVRVAVEQAVYAQMCQGRGWHGRVARRRAIGSQRGRKARGKAFNGGLAEGRAARDFPQDGRENGRRSPAHFA